MSSPHAPDDDRPPVYRITNARKGITEDVNARQRRYLISMGIRTVCFILAILASGWLRWVLVIGALVLPYVAVVIANAGREPAPGPPTSGMPDQPSALPGAPTGLPGPAPHGTPHGPTSHTPTPPGPASPGPTGERPTGGDTPH